GGMIASYSNRYGTAYGMTETSLRYRDAANGGVSWISQFEDSKGMQFNDGVIPDGVFEKGTQVKAPNGDLVNVGGMSFKDAMDAGYVEPVHASGWHQYNNSWSRGTVNDDWFSEVNYIALREVSLHYSAPANWASKIGARRLGFGFSARNLGYLYNSLPNNLNPEGVRGSSSTNSFMERSFIPYTASYTMSVNVEF
ncbi:MAG: SusC/RagA family TonB-linked outer membrane protein, partial [Tannerellaceae bacterium]